MKPLKGSHNFDFAWQCMFVVLQGYEYPGIIDTVTEIAAHDTLKYFLHTLKLSTTA